MFVYHIPGMFPWVCLATMPLFYPFDWPKIVYKFSKDEITKTKKFVTKMIYHNHGHKENDVSEKNECNEEKDKQFNESNRICSENDNSQSDNDRNISKKIKTLSDDNPEQNIVQRKITTILIILYITIQAFLPYSHFITKASLCFFLIYIYNRFHIYYLPNEFYSKNR